MNKLAINGGPKIIRNKQIHAKWPPNANKKEISEIGKQRNLDINISGKTGPIRKFEEMFLKFMNNEVKYAITFNSGTSGLLAAYIAIGIEEGDEVIGPALTYHAALSPLHILKAKVILADVEINSRCISPKSIKKLLTPQTKAITVVHQWGHPADMDAIIEIAKKYNLAIIEDCSHAHGSKYKNKLVGTFGDVAVFSLQTNKAMFAGEGGILVTNNQNIHDRATLVGHYRNRSKTEITNPFYNQYWATGFGLKLRMSPFNAIVAQHSLLNFKKIIFNRHKCLNYLTKRLTKEITFIEPPVISKNVNMGAWYGYKPIYKSHQLNNISREKFIKIVNAEGTQISAPSGGILSKQILYHDKYTKFFPKFARYQNKIENTPNATFLETHCLSFPTFSNWERDKKIIDQYILIFKKVENLKKTLAKK